MVGAMTSATLVPASTQSTENDRQRTAIVARALSDPKRLCVLETLATGERSVSELSRDVGCQVPNMSQHLGVLRSAGLVTARREGTTIYYSLADPRVIEAYRLMQNISR
jgi:ArsR family transcriptional regulator